MVWLELRTQSNIYLPSWNFAESVWIPTHKKNGSNWPFWNLVNKVIKGDLVFHLRYVNNEKKFVGYSIAASDGYVTYELPTVSKHDWDFSNTYYKADLINFTPLEPTIRLED